MWAENRSQCAESGREVSNQKVQFWIRKNTMVAQTRETLVKTERGKLSYIRFTSGFAYELLMKLFQMKF